MKRMTGDLEVMRVVQWGVGIMDGGLGTPYGGGGGAGRG